MPVEPVAIAVVGAVLSAPLFATQAWRRARTSTSAVLLAAVVAVCVTWLGFAWLVAVDYRDADGFADCWPNCSVWQGLVGWVLPLGPVVALFLAGATAIFSRRSTRAAR